MKFAPFTVKDEEHYFVQVDAPVESRVKISESKGDLVNLTTGIASGKSTHTIQRDHSDQIVYTAYYTVTDSANRQAGEHDDLLISRDGHYYVVPAGPLNTAMLNDVQSEKGVETIGWVPNQYRITDQYRDGYVAALKKAAADKAENELRLAAQAASSEKNSLEKMHSVETSDVTKDGDFEPSFYGVVAPGVAGAVSGAVAADVYFKMSCASAAMGLVTPLVITPALAGVLAYGFVYVGAQLQHLAEHGRFARRDEMDRLKITNAARDSGQQLAVCLFGAGAAKSIGYAMNMMETMPTWEFPDVSVLGTVEMKLALMVFAGIGLGFGLTAVVWYQNYRDKKAYAKENYGDITGYQGKTASDYLATFLIGFGIGAACSVGYGDKVANYLMPGAATLLGLALLPTTKNAADRVAVAASATAADMAGLASSGKTYLTNRWDQFRSNSPVVDTNISTVDVERENDLTDSNRNAI